MAKFTNDSAPDAYLDDVALSDRQFLCSAQPTTYAEASTTFNLGTQTLTAGDGNGDFAITDGDTSGRKLTVAAQSGVAISASGNITHVAYGVSGSSALKHVTTCTSTAVTSGGTADIGSHKLEVGDPT